MRFFPPHSIPLFQIPFENYLEKPLPHIEARAPEAHCGKSLLPKTVLKQIKKTAISQHPRQPDKKG